MFKSGTLRTFVLASSLSLILVNQLSLSVLAATGGTAEPKMDNSGSQSAAAEQSQPAQPSSAATRADEINLKGIISAYSGPSPDQLVGGLVNAAVERDDARDGQLAKKDKAMNGGKHKLMNAAKMTAAFATEYRGFEMSSEAADVILDEKVKLKSKGSTAYAKQRRADEIHAKVFSSVLQIAQGLGTTDPALKEKTIAAGMGPLKDLVGPESADAALKSLQSWSEQLNVPRTVFKQQPWTIGELQQKSEDLVKTSSQADPVMALVRRALHKYNGHSKFALGAAKLCNITLATAMFSPTIAAPAAEILLFVYQMGTGGPEDYKLLQELYFDKRLECRWKRLNQESTQAVTAYNNALMTRNPVLLGLSETFISALGGEEAGSRIVGSNRLVARKSTHDDSIDCMQTHETPM